MYSDKKKSWRRFLPAAVLALVILALAASFAAGHDPGRDLSEEGAAAIREAVRKTALQCYVVEGVYPPDLQYLEDNYGLQVNREDYYVSYNAFASNLPPAVKVVSRHGAQ